MGKVLKLLVGLVVVVVLLVVAAVVVVPLVVDPNDYKAEISEQVKAATGRDLSIQGDIGLSVFPWLGLELGRLELSNAPGFDDAPFSAVERAQVRAKLLPLLQKRVEVDTVVLEGLRLNLGRTKSGRSNWDDLVKPSGETQPGPEPTEKKAPAAMPTALAVGGVVIKDARVVWDDRFAGQHVTIDKLRLEAGAVRPGEPVDLEFEFVVLGKEPEVTGHLKLEGTVLLAASMDKVTVEPLRLEVTDLRGFGGLDGELALKASVLADMGAQRYEVHGLNLDTAMKAAALGGGPVKAVLAGDLVADLAAQTLNVSALTVKSEDLNLAAEINGRSIVDAPAFSGSIKVAEFDLRRWLGAMGQQVPETADPEVLKRVSLELSLASNPNRINVDPIKLNLDDSVFSGNLVVSDLQRSAVGFDLSLDSIDVDRYLPPPAEEAPASAPPPRAAAGEKLFPVDALRALNIDGVVRVGEIKAAKLRAKDIKVTVTAKNGKINVDQVIRQIYEGNLRGSVGLDVSGRTPGVRVQNYLTDIEAGPLLQDLIGKDRMTGKGQVNMVLNASGDTQEALTRSLSGNLDLSFRDGAVKGFNLGRIIREAKAKFKGEPSPPPEADQTDFSELSATATITDGILRNQDLDAKSPFLRVTGKGEADLPAQKLDYTAKAVIVSTEKGQGGEGLEELKGVPIPVRAKGPFDQLAYSVDWKEVLTETQKAKVDEAIEKEKGKIEEKLKGKLDKFFK